MKKLITAVLGGTAVASLAFASASAMSVDGGNMQTGADRTLACQEGEVKVDWALETDDSAIYFATVTGIDESCFDSVLAFRTNTMSKPLSTTIDSTSERFTFETPIDAESLDSVRLWIGR